MSDYIAVCELFESKPALYYSDDNYHINKIGSFITKDFNINFGSIGGTVNGEVSSPQGFSLGQPLKLGDIVQVTLLNFPNGLVTYNYISDDAEFQIEGNQLRRCFVISSIDGNRLVLKDYVEYNHSYVTVGYVGSVRNQSLMQILSILGQREMRAFASKMYTYQLTNTTTFKSPLIFQPGDASLMTSFEDDFSRTNVKPFDIIKSAISNALATGKSTSTTKRGEAPITLGATVERDSGGYFVAEFVRVNHSIYTVSTRIKPHVNISTTPMENEHSCTVWVQPDENSDDYIRAGVVVATKADENSPLVLKKNDEIGPAEYNGYGITAQKSLLIGYSDLFTGWYTETNEDAVKDKIEKLTNGFKSSAGKPISYDNIKQLVDNAVDSGFVDIPQFDGSDNYDQEPKRIMAKAVRNSLIGSLTQPYTPVVVELGENDFYQTNVNLTGEENIKLWYNSSNGGAINGVNARCVNVNYASAGRKYTIKTTSYEGKVIVIGGSQ